MEKNHVRDDGGKKMIVQLFEMFSQSRYTSFFAKYTKGET